MPTEDNRSAPTSASLTTDPQERYPGELQALVDYWAEDADLSPSDARKHAVEMLTSLGFADLTSRVEGS